MTGDTHSDEPIARADPVETDDARRPWYSPFRLIDWMSPWLPDRRTTLIVATVLAVVLTLPSLWLGWQTDDHFHRAALTDEFERLADARRSPSEMFTFIKEGLTDYPGAIDRGDLPWWSAPNLRLAFFRPVTGLTHWVDYRFWPHAPWLMHVQSIVWYAVTVVLATLLFRRIAPSAIVAGLAAIIFAIDDAHGLPANWLANRNGTIAICFGIAALLAHDRWRANGKSLAALLAPVFIAASVLANEGGVATCAYLFAYALILDRDRTWRRFAALLPAIAVVAVWWWSYRTAGYGAAGSSFYVDPAADPTRFARAVVDRAPGLLNGLLAWPPIDFQLMMSAPLVKILWAFSIAVIALLAVMTLPLLRSEPRMRFAAIGMMLSIIPVCATLPSVRLTMFAGIGGSMIIAQLIVLAWRSTVDRGQRIGSSRLFRTVAGVLIVIHLIAAPIGLAISPKYVADFGRLSVNAAEGLPDDDAITRQRLMIVSTPSVFTAMFAGVYAATQHRPTCKTSLVLASGSYPVEVSRIDKHTLRITPDGGWLLPAGHWPDGDASQFVWVGKQYMTQPFDSLFRDEQPFVPGQRIELSDGVIEIVSVTIDGRPATVDFQFTPPLEDPRYRWIYWKNGTFASFELPRVGQSVTLPAPRPGMYE